MKEEHYDFGEVPVREPVLQTKKSLQEKIMTGQRPNADSLSTRFNFCDSFHFSVLREDKGETEARHEYECWHCRSCSASCRYSILALGLG